MSAPTIDHPVHVTPSLNMREFGASAKLEPCQRMARPHHRRAQFRGRGFRTLAQGAPMDALRTSLPHLQRQPLRRRLRAKQ